MQRSIRSNTWKTYLYQIFYQSDHFYFPVVGLLWLAKGLSLFQIALLQAFFSIALFVFDLPSGYIADQWGRKRSLLLGGIFLTTGSGVYIFAGDFIQFLAAEFFLALGFAFISGADSAMLYDSLASEGKEGEYQRLWGKAGFYKLTCIAFFNIIGGLAATIYLRVPFYFAFAGMIILIPLALSFVEPSVQRKEQTRNHLSNILRILKWSLIENTKTRYLIINSSILYAFTLVTLWFYQPYFKLAGVRLFYFGFIFASFELVAAPAAHFAHHLNQIFGRKLLLLLLLGFVVLNYFLISWFVFPFSFIFMYLLQISRGVQSVVLSDYLNQETTSEIRATVLSIQSSMGTLFYTIILLIFGATAEHIGLPQTFLLTSIFLFVIGGMSLALMIRNKVI